MPLFGETRCLMLRRHQRFLAAGNAAVDEIGTIDRRLAEIREAITPDHPLDSAAVAELREAIRSSVTTFLLRERGIRVVAEAENGIEALQLVKEYSPAILLLDMRMPRLDGLAVLQTMRAENIRVKVLAFSVYDEEEYVHGLYDHGGSGYLLKDESPQMLFSVLMRIAQGESGFYSAAIARILRSWGHQFEDRLNSHHT